MEGCRNHTGELVQPPHLPAGVDETDTANVVHLLMLLTMHARQEYGEASDSWPFRPTHHLGSVGVVCRAVSRFSPQHHEFGSRHRDTALDWTVAQ